MRQAESQLLSDVEAACAIYGTQHPTEQQIGQVRLRISRGVLDRSDNGGWTTTSRAVADFLAKAAVHHRNRATSPAAAAGEAVEHERRAALAARRVRDEAGLDGFYRDLLRDYFLAVVLRRKTKRSSATFGRAVSIGQIAVLLLPIWLVYFGYRTVVALTAPPEHAAVLAWLEENAAAHKVAEWFSPVDYEEGTGRLIRVRYKYTGEGSPKAILTDRLFVVADGRVVNVVQTE